MTASSRDSPYFPQNQGLGGGGSGIRTRDGVAPIHALQACALDHSATPPIAWAGETSRARAAPPPPGHGSWRGAANSAIMPDRAHGARGPAMVTRRGFLSGMAAAGATLGCPALIGAGAGRRCHRLHHAPGVRSDLHRHHERLFRRPFREARARLQGAGPARQRRGLSARARRPGAVRLHRRARLDPRRRRPRTRRSWRSPRSASGRLPHRQPRREAAAAPAPICVGKTIGVISVGRPVGRPGRCRDDRRRRQARATPSASPPATAPARSSSSATAGSTASSAISRSATRCSSRRKNLAFIDIDKVLPAPGGAYYTTQRDDRDQARHRAAHAARA